MATRMDVARLAKVSGATVSYVMNNTKRMSPEVRERVLNAAATLDYHPNLVGRSLVSRKTNHVALLVDNLRNPHYGELLEGVQEAAEERGYLVSVLCASAANVKTVVDLVSRGVDGAILTQLETEAASYLRGRMPCIGAESQVVINYRGAIFDMVECFKKSGHRKIAFLSGLALDNNRHRAFCEALEHFGLERDEGLITGGSGEFRTDEETGFKAMSELLSRRTDFTAVYGLNDLMCVGAVTALRARGYAIPGDISICGCDHLKILGWFSPALATIEVYPFETGRALMNNLADILKG
jgi:LacI family transcriptional regulator